VEDHKVLLELASDHDDLETLREVTQGLEGLRKEVRTLELQTALAGEYDRGNAIVSINPGAGGTESQDWAEMLLRMYLRWCESKGFKTELIELLGAKRPASRTPPSP